MKKLLLFLMCFSFQTYAMVDGDIGLGDDTLSINMVYGRVMTCFDMIIS